MAIFTGVLVFAILWWLVFFVTLPFGVRTPEESGKESEPGHAASAPIQPRLGLKVLITTAVTAVLWGGVYVVITYHLITLPPLVQQ